MLDYYHVLEDVCDVSLLVFQFDTTVTLHLPQPHCTTLCSLHHCQQVQFGNHSEAKHKPGFLE